MWNVAGAYSKHRSLMFEYKPQTRLPSNRKMKAQNRFARVDFFIPLVNSSQVVLRIHLTFWDLTLNNFVRLGLGSTRQRMIYTIIDRKGHFIRSKYFTLSRLKPKKLYSCLTKSYFYLARIKPESTKIFPRNQCRYC